MIDVAIVVLFVLYCVSSGLSSRKQASQNLTEYFLAGRSLKGWRAGVSMAATQYAADTPLLVAGLVALSGVFSLWRIWSYGIAFLVMGFLLGRAWRRAGVLTDAELTEIRYSGAGVPWLRGLKALYYGVLINCIVLAFVLVAATRIFEIFLLWHEWLPSAIYGPLERVVGVTGLEFWSGEFLSGEFGAGDPSSSAEAASSGMSGSAGGRLTPSQATTNSVLSAALLLAFVGFYSTTGGLRSVVDTDVVQFAFTMIGTAIYAVFAVNAAGGLDGMVSAVTELYGSERAERLLGFVPPPEEALGPFLAVLGLQWLFQMNSDGTGYLAQRTMACSTEQQARWAAVVFTFVQVVLRSLLWLPIVVALLVLYPFAEPPPSELLLDRFSPDQLPPDHFVPDQLLPDPALGEAPVVDTLPGERADEALIAAREITFARGIDDLLPAGARGLMLTGMLAALASTIDTHLNWGASYVSNDLYGALWCERIRKRTPSKRELVTVARLSNLLIVALAVSIMVHLGSIRTAWQVSLLFGAGIGAVLVLRWLWERINLWCEVAAILASLVLAPLLLWLVEADWLRLTLMALGSTAVVVVTALLTEPTEPERLVAFYRRVEPPGFWGRTARAAGAEPEAARRALREGLIDVAGAGVSAYGLLVGGGLLLIRPASWPWAVLALLLAVAAAPVWTRRLRSSPAAPSGPSEERAV